LRRFGSRRSDSIFAEVRMSSASAPRRKVPSFRQHKERQRRFETLLTGGALAAVLVALVVLLVVIG
jgi:hypothetical protein